MAIVYLRSRRKANAGKSDGFALPTVLISSMIMLVVLVASVVSTAAVRVSLVAQYYQQIAQSASDAGTVYANACLSASNGVAKWSDASPLKPGTDCSGALLSGCPVDTANVCHYVLKDGVSLVVSSFSVGTPSVGVDGKVQSFNSVGKVNLIRKTGGSTWRTYTKNTVIQKKFTGLVSNGLVMSLDAGNQRSYAGSGTTWTDLTGNNHNATLASGVGYTSTDGGAITFDGALTHYASVGFLGNFFNQGTISFWMKPAPITNHLNPFTTNYNGGAVTNAGIRFEEHSSGGSVFDVIIGNDAGTATTTSYLSSGLTTNWVNVVLVWDKTNNNITGYMNNESKFSGISQTNWPTVLPDVTIGEGYSATVGRLWNGSISAVQIYNRALSPSEVQQNYSALSGRYP